MKTVLSTSFQSMSLFIVLVSFQSCGNLTNDDDAFENMCSNADYAQSFRSIYQANEQQVSGVVSKLAAAKTSLASCKQLLTLQPENGACNVEVEIQGKRRLVSIAGSEPFQTDQFLRSQCNDWIVLVEESERE